MRVLIAQGCGGSIVFVGSKNALVAGANASAYSSAKAASLHLARCLAEEGGKHGIRVNTVNPDAVLEGSSLWSSEWKAERASTYGVSEEELPTFYRGRTRLGVNVFAEDVAEAIGDGVLLHPPFARVAPRHGRTVGRPWVLAPQAIFNLLGLPATEVPMGLGERRLPLGVQVAAGRDRDHVAIAVALELERAFGGWVPPIAAAHSATVPL
jgi:Asp-tRNA(Asn)/Glu-tRNA(Gln) amidotransferase A subunit family amidase